MTYSNMLNNNTVIKNTIDAVRRSISKDRFTDRSREVTTSLNALSRKDTSNNRPDISEIAYANYNNNDSFQCQIGSPRAIP